MPLRTILLRVMLWSLGIAAVTGVLSVLTQSGAVAWRVVGTAITTAVASALMLPVSALVDRNKTRPAGIVGMGAVTVEFLSALFLIWEIPQALWGVRWEEELAGTMSIVCGAAICLMIFLQLQNTAAMKVASRVGMIATAVTFGAWLLFAWGVCVRSVHLQRAYCEEDWGQTGAATAVSGILVVLCLIAFGTATRRPWRWPGIVASGVACAMWLVNIWLGTGSDLGTVIFTVLLSLAAVTAHANVCLMCTLPPHQRWVRVGTIAAATCTATLICLIVIDDILYWPGFSSNVLHRFAAASGIVTGCGTMALAVLARLNRKVDYEPLSPELTQITVVCPRCAKKQSVSLGDSVCAGCKLRISIRIEEPRCPQCGYLLYGLTSDRCPECGTHTSLDVTGHRHADA